MRLVALSLLLCACDPCVRSHPEVWHYPEQTIWVVPEGIPMQIEVPAHDKIVVVCDQHKSEFVAP